uniref:Uncharacterized protein n=1 Tax=Anguilla anguilla TaxID=7936 RepID=A0A0E9WZB7_ANGAN
MQSSPHPTIMFGKNRFAGVSDYLGVCNCFLCAGLRMFSICSLDSSLLISFGVCFLQKNFEHNEEKNPKHLSDRSETSDSHGCVSDYCPFVPNIMVL